jgi:cell division protein FtsN
MIAAAAHPPTGAGALVPTSMSSGPTRYLQIGVFSDPVNAATMRDQLIGLGFQQVQMRSEKRESAYLYRVMIGPLLDVALVDTARRRLSELQLPAIPLAN